MRTGDIDKLQLLGLESVLSQFTLVGNQIYILLYLCDILKWKVGVYPFISDNGDAFVGQYPFVFIGILINGIDMVSFQILGECGVQCDTFSVFA